MADETNVIVNLMDVRTSYFYGFEPYIGTDNAGKQTKSYCSHFFLKDPVKYPNGHPSLPLVQSAIKSVAQAMWKDKAGEMLKAFAGQDRICLHNGDISKPGEDSYSGMLYLSGNSKNRFTIVETRGGKNVPLLPADGRPYSGCYVNAIVSIWAQANKWGKRINCQIQGVQFLRNGDAFGGGRVAAPEEFGIVATDADAAAPETAEESNDLAGLLG
jgi:hypothetical protein